MATDTHGAETHAADAAHAAAEAGMPQLDFATFPNQIFWLLVTLVVIYFVLSKIALPRISSVLAERSGTIMNDISAAEELKLKAKEAEEAYNAALAEAKAKAQQIAGEARAAIQADLDAATAKADAQIAAKAAESEKAIAAIRDGAMDSVKDVAKETAKELVAAMGSTADGRTINAAVTARLKG
ncbi:F0F1 ATP synthase subunit B' [Celeribacter halophilus]|jgi:F-type H+-transporting ATPase subunit b|uniref:ATP synthase subunit b n=1 Tax=Celeribacter halophilus TaxID=576117 RepID=A0A1I3V1N9_9RHOB|nr:F0F1 ATP synthase subunit B' [Celeribacter halophilus]MBU2888953.1 F0F1 ATP synthase subunit B' [Celeribacter halophilus]MDO6456454.1 F0F1 ATP synthase subunit B' [Celeribacter halophilus]MDO6510518.1 F0F1 ATP synthase subunit B' [Celeribacter halophilus]MDO6722917.1 F0F1 ATP synthase subunit B' [Celeribacter halophilus]PZX09733.1 F-type H+-transporting ATPase subunit b [Celeribacter halophilus]